MKAKVGKYVVIHTQTLLIPNGQEAWIEFQALSWHVKLKLLLTIDSNNPNDSRYEIYGEEDYGVVKLINWDASTMAFKEPNQFGKTEGKNIFIMVFGTRIGDTTKLDVQFYKEETL